MARKRRASLFFDQAGRHRREDLGIDDVIGWYGSAAVEAMALGIPTIAHLSETALGRAEAAGMLVRECPVINIERSAQGLARAILDFARATPAERQALSARTRAFAEAFHGYEAVARRLARVYESLIPAAPPATTRAGSAARNQ
jgi:glycosyltransferase involved in cell wall biosynthesis